MRQVPETALELAEKLPTLAKNTVTVLEKRYLDKNDAGEFVEDPNGLFWRVASTLAANGSNYGLSDEANEANALNYFELMRSFDFLPNSPTLANAGTRTGQLSACFVIPIDDALANGQSGIYDSLTKAQLIFQTGGGVGYAFSRLRASSMLVSSTKGKSSGPMSYMDVYDKACESIAQGGMRRGAQMGILRVDHPDILLFIDYKQDLSKLTNFNVSVGVTDEFLDALAEGRPYELIDPKYGPTGITLDPAMVWDRIITRAWSTGEPGVVFLGRMNRHNPNPGLGEYEATNPCGEQPLVPYESCNLGSINLDNFVITVDGKNTVDWNRLAAQVRMAIRMMDDVVDVNEYVPARGHNPGVPEIREVTLQTRKLGLGVMGHARMLYRLGLAYDSEEGREVSEKVYAFIDVVSKLESIDLAKERGMFPYMAENRNEVTAFYHKDWNSRIASLLQADRETSESDLGGITYAQIAIYYEEAIGLMVIHGIRNSTTTTVAPTGTISIIADTSGGCEPVFALVISRWQADTEMFETDKVFAGELRMRGFTEAEIEHVYRALGQSKGSLQRMFREGSQLNKVLSSIEKLKVLEEMAQVYVVAEDVAPENHVRMQAALQKYCDSAISKTVNFPKEATVEQVKAVYDLALKLNCKGVTIYRDGCRSFQPLTAGDKKAEAKVHEVQVNLNEATKAEANIEVSLALHPEPRVRPERLLGFTDTVMTGDGKMYATVNYDDDGMREVVVEIGRSGGTLNSLTEAIGRLISLALQYGVPVREIVHKLKGIRSANVYGFGPKQVLSIPDAIAKLLDKAPVHYGVVVGAVELPSEVPAEPVVATPVGADEVRVSRVAALDLGESPECPSCGAPMKFGEGCKGGTCTDPACGYAKC